MSNKRIDFTQLGGFPLTQDALDFMQQCYRDAITGLAKLGGDKVILSGMVEAAGNVSAGWIVYLGELLPFQAGAKQTYFVVEDVTGTETFEDDSVKTVYHTRQARFGSGAGQIAYADLYRLSDILTLQTTLDALNANLTTLNTALAAHEADEDNPHAVTKAQVGLSNIPNAISDSTILNDSYTLATSAAVFALANKILLTGSYHIGDVSDTVDGFKQIQINLANNVNDTYMVIGSLRSVGTTAENDGTVYWMVRSLAVGSFQLLLRETKAQTQDLYFDYCLIKL